MGKLDFLIIDSPPGTGDEPLSVAQTITGVQALIVTTPQEISLADVRKAINFCRKVGMPILGLVENMSGFICPRCGEEILRFSKGGGEKTAAMMGVPLLAGIPFDLQVVQSGDAGRPLAEAADSPFIKAMGRLLDEVEKRLRASGEEKLVAPAEKIAEASPAANLEGRTFKVAVPVADGVLCNHFGHCEKFAVMQVQEGKVGAMELHVPPLHEPGVLPRWLGELGVNVIVAGGMGQRALSLFTEQGIKVVTGAPNLAPETLVQQYLAGSLVTGPNVCDH